MARIYIGLGSNIEREHYLQRGLLVTERRCDEIGPPQ